MEGEICEKQFFTLFLRESYAMHIFSVRQIELILPGSLRHRLLLPYSTCTHAMPCRLGKFHLLVHAFTYLICQECSIFNKTIHRYGRKNQSISFRSSFATGTFPGCYARRLMFSPTTYGLIIRMMERIDGIHEKKTWFSCSAIMIPIFSAFRKVFSIRCFISTVPSMSTVI